MGYAIQNVSLINAGPERERERQSLTRVERCESTDGNPTRMQSQIQNADNIGSWNLYYAQKWRLFTIADLQYILCVNIYVLMVQNTKSKKYSKIRN